jgi:hypothetical protein
MQPQRAPKPEPGNRSFFPDPGPRNPETGNRKPEPVLFPEPGTRKPFFFPGNRKPETGNRKPFFSRNPEPGTRKPFFSRNPEPGNRKPIFPLIPKKAEQRDESLPDLARIRISDSPFERRIGSLTWISRNYVTRGCGITSIGLHPEKICSRRSRTSARGAGQFCRGGGIGRRARFRSWWGNPWRFESSPRHQKANKIKAFGSHPRAVACLKAGSRFKVRRSGSRF